MHELERILQSNKMPKGFDEKFGLSNNKNNNNNNNNNNNSDPDNNNIVIEEENAEGK
jgi:hypothetical protein